MIETTGIAPSPRDPFVKPANAVGPWLIASLLIAALQIAAGLAWPQQVPVTAIGLGAQALLLSVYAARKGLQKPRQRILWWLLATAMLFWGLAFGWVFALRDVLGSEERRALLDSILFIARGAPFMLMLTSGIDEEAYGRVWWLDINQAVVFAAAALLLLGSPWPQGTDPGPKPDPHLLRELQMAALTVLALGVAVLQRNRRNAQIFRPLAALLLTSVIAGAIINRVLIETLHVASGSPAFVIGALPVLAFLTVRAMPLRARPALPTRLAASLGLLAPAVLPMATLVLVLTGGRGSDMAGKLLGIGAILLYGWRMVAIQLRHRTSIATLTAAHTEAAGLSLIDPLTGLGNRRRLDIALGVMIAASGGGPTAVLMIDVDWFKAYNDSLGHAAGDTALRRIGAVLREHSPVGGIVARLGGEEFVVLTQLPDIAAAMRLAEQLRAAVAALAIAHPRAPGSHLTISIGVAMTEAGNADTLMAAADTALYAAKNHGRNCVHAARSAGAT